MITRLSATRLRLELDRYLWRDVDNLGLKKLWEYLASYLYLPRLCDQNVLIEAVQDGIGQFTWTENFAYAEGWDEARQRYLGLKAGHMGERSPRRADPRSQARGGTAATGGGGGRKR